MILLSKNQEPVLDCESEVMVDLMELADAYVQWYRGHDVYTVKIFDGRTTPIRTVTSEAIEPLVALKGAFNHWSQQ